MKILLSDIKEKKFRLIPENVEDLWHLSLFINKGDIVKSKSKRKIKKEGSKKQIIKTIFVKITVEKIEFKRENNELKILGKIIESSEEISGYHSIHVKENSEITIEKNEINKIFLKKILEKENNEKLLGCIFDNHDAIIFEILNKRIRIIDNVKIRYGKRFENKGNAFKEIFDRIDEIAKNYKTIILGFSIFWKKTVDEILDKKEWKNKIIWVNINNPTENGIHQLLRSEELKNMLKDFRIQFEEKIMNEALKRMKNNYRIDYGFKEIADGSVETLIISEDLLIEDYDKYKKMLEDVEKYNGKIIIIETDEAKKQLNNLGKIIAFLRY